MMTLTAQRAREIIRAQSQFPYWGNFERFMTPDEITFVRKRFENHPSGSITFAGIVERVARSDMFQAPPNFDDKDAEIARTKLANWNKRQGPRVGDFVIMPDGEHLRFTYDWGDGLQTTCRKFRQDVSFFFADGHMSFSGSLDPSIPRNRLVDTGEIKEGSAWFFHHGETRAHNGVHFTVPCRVFKVIEP